MIVVIFSNRTFFDVYSEQNSPKIWFFRILDAKGGRTPLTGERSQ